MAASCTIIGVIGQGSMHYNLEKPSYDYLLQFWNNHQNCICDFCKSTVPFQQPNIHVKDNPKLLISDYPSLMASDTSKESSCSKEKTNQLLTCETCGKEFRLKKWYKKHTIVCSKNKICSTCGKLFSCERYLRDHIRKVHTCSVYSCTTCLKSFKTRVSLENHRKRMHTPTEQRFPCTEDQCDKTFGCKQSLMRHMKSHGDDVKQHHCEYCHTYFQSSYNLKRHKLMQHVRKTIRCTLCDMLFDTLDHWWQHIDTAHEKKRYQCKECPLSFDSQKNLRRHTLVHTTQKSFHCGLCDKSFKLKKSLLFHQTHRHLRNRAYPCLRCGKKFSRRYILTTHMKIHAPKTFHCQLDNCNDSFHTQYRLACHVATRHHTYFVQTRRLRAASSKERNKMIRESQCYIQHSDYSSYSYPQIW